MQIVSICSGCIRRYDKLYDGVSALSLWDMADSDPDFPFPDYGGAEMSVLDACPTRSYGGLHSTVRSILGKMNIKVTEPVHTGTNGKCCGDSYYGRADKSAVLEKMRERAEEMPSEDVAVYCVSCIKAVSNGGKTPRYLPDLLFGEHTFAGECDPDKWHEAVEGFIKTAGRP
ncbi:MAG: (Fe-S)-binding protein [Geovibrio sp.]|nr:(Fe-S)-binding protein [Geovibrio sp.]